MLNNQVLILGSKPESKLPDLEVDEIFSANAAAERGRIYKEKYNDIPLTSIVGAREFLKNDLVKNFIINSKPQNVLVRTGEIDKKKYFNENCNIKHLSWNEQFEIQKKFFRYKSLSIISAELINWKYTSRNSKLYRKLLHLYRTVKNGQFWGISTGFFAILYAMYKYPNSKIIVSGIGMSGGKQFYKSERSKIHDYSPRSRVDRFLANHLKYEFRNKIYSLDEDFIRNCNCLRWKGLEF